jgi:predicted N-formylglutamate amidohydrolase
MVQNDSFGPARHPFRTVTGDSGSGLVVICDHASNHVPAELEGLGLPADELQRHIAWDIGAAAVAELLAARFRAPAILCGTSRLVIDCNRDPADPAAMPEASDGTLVPGNHGLSVWPRAQRIARWFTPYHAEIARIIETALAGDRDPVLLSIHSMTPVMRSYARPWPVALSWYQDRRLSVPMLAALRRRIADPVGDNEPYGLDPAEDYSVPVHALRRGLRHLQVEFRQDLVADEAGAAHWAQLFGDALAEVVPEI